MPRECICLLQVELKDPKRQVLTQILPPEQACWGRLPRRRKQRLSRTARQPRRRRVLLAARRPRKRQQTRPPLRSLLNAWSPGHDEGDSVLRT